MTEGWLEPLLDRIARDPTTVQFTARQYGSPSLLQVVCPVIDVLNEQTLAYQVAPAAL